MNATAQTADSQVDFVILTALEEERDAVLSKLPGYRKLDRVGEEAHTYYEASIESRREDRARYRLIVTSLARMGPIEAAAKGPAIAQRWKPRRILMVGIAGGIAGEVHLGDVLVASEIQEYSLGKTEVNRPRQVRWKSAPLDASLYDAAANFRTGWEDLVQVPRPTPGTPRRHTGLFASGGDVIASPDMIAEFKEKYPKLAGVEMEGGALGIVLHQTELRPGLLMIRGISDLADAAGNAATKQLWRLYACDVAAAYSIGLLKEGPLSPSPLQPPPLLQEPTHTLGDKPRSTEASRLPVQDAYTAESLVRMGIEQQQSNVSRRFRYVLNFGGTLASNLPEQIEALRDGLCEASDEATMEVTRIEASAGQVFVTTQADSLATLAGSQFRDTLEARGFTLLGCAEETTFNRLQSSKASLQQASHDLLAWPQTLPGGQRIQRPELRQLILRIDESESSATAVLGPPGAGKSALLASAAQELLARGWPVLGIKADALDPNVNDEIGLQRQLMLDESPSRLLTQFSEFGPTVLVIDQLDALAGFVDLRTGRLNVLLNLLRRCGRRNNVHIIVSVRTFEFNHDVRLRSIEADALSLDLPPWTEVMPVLVAHNLNPEDWPADAQETLRTPQHLATFLRLARSSSIEPFHNYQAMLERLWMDRVLHAPNGQQLARLATDIAKAMAEEESLWLARSRYDDYAKDLLDLERLEILKPSADGVALGFSHQTLYDYVLARSFARGKGRLSGYVAGRETSLFLRPKLWVALTYLRNTEVSTYENELATIWHSEGLRSHLRMLLIEFMGQQKDPIEIERRLMKPILESGPERTLAFSAIAGSPGWFAATTGSVIATTMAESEESAWLVTGVLKQAWDFAPTRVLSLLKQNWAQIPKFDTHCWTVIDEILEWPSEVTDLAITIINRTPLALFHIEHVAAHLGVNQPAIALRMVRARLDCDLATAEKLAIGRAQTPKPAHTELADDLIWQFENSPSRPLKDLIEQEQDWDILSSLAETSPGHFLSAMWPWFIRVLDAIARASSPKTGQQTYPLSGMLNFHFDDGEDQVDSYRRPPLPILRAFRIAIEKLAETPELLRSFVAKNLNLEAEPAQRLLAHALARDGKEYAQDAFDFLMADSRRFFLGSSAHEPSTTQALIRAASIYWSEEKLVAFVRRIRTYRPPPTPKLDAERMQYRARSLRIHCLRLLKTLPQEKLDQEIKNFIRQESRVFQGERSRALSFGFKSIDSPMSTEAMLKASDENILNAFRRIPDLTESTHPIDSRRSGNFQLSHAFADFAKQRPERAVRLISHFEPTFGSRASGLALRALAETATPSLIVTTLLDAVRRGFASEEFRSSSAGAIERLANRNLAIDDEVISLLQDWLSDASDLDVNEVTSAEEHDLRSKTEEHIVRPILWDTNHIYQLPHGNFPTLEALTRALLVRGESDRVVQVWERHLTRREHPKVWRALLHYLPYLKPTDTTARGRLLGELFHQYPQLTESREAIHLLGHAHWWALEHVQAVLYSWRARENPWLQQVLGELSLLVATTHPTLDWATSLLNEGLASNSTPERKIGIAFSAARLWKDAKLRAQANAILVILIPQADGKLWGAILDIFRIVTNLGETAEAPSLLDSIAANIRKAGHQDNTPLIEQLQNLLPEYALPVGRIADGIIDNMISHLENSRSKSIHSSPELVDIAITLHRLGGPLRDLGIHLFEQMLRINAYSARATLEEIDSRFPSGPRPITRPRLPRRSAKAKSA
ncbi:phosphorylase family protein [Myxococcus qinghaiensis]|uniref:phosphorylase family protein n=1 Tax=Myxococcus qinghaiensis TaxID=2906758 RepID=UPI0020A81708|nr:AAA family ATPase [Myxococcus qinghaiensis]MCP3165160.1 AAA family ATPase [Myxococcus qinghaiensis]